MKEKRRVRAWLIFLPLLASVACLVAVACGDDPGGSDLPYAYSLDATPDGVIQSADDASVNRH